MTHWLEGIFQFLFKYRPTEFAKGDFAFGAPYSIIILLLAAAAIAFAAVMSYAGVRGKSSRRDRWVLGGLRVAALATVFSSSVAADIRAQQDKLQDSQITSTARFGVCETPGVRSEENLPPGVDASLASLSTSMANAAKTKILSTLKVACSESIQGFEKAYRITFFAAIGALILGAFLPGWPAKWGGRGSAPMPAAD